MTKGLPLYSGIGHIVDGWLETALQAAPLYRVQFAAAVQWIQRCIHGLKEMHPSGDLRQLEVYLGRATRSTLAQRWASHAENKEHDFGAIVFRCEPDVVECLEDVAIRILGKLRASHALCVGNANIFDGNWGRGPRDEEALVYMTWRTLGQPCRYGKPSLNDLREIASTVHQETPYKEQITRGQIQRGLRYVRRVSTCARLYWWNPSC